MKGVWSKSLGQEHGVWWPKDAIFQINGRMLSIDGANIKIRQPANPKLSLIGRFFGDLYDMVNFFWDTHNSTDSRKSPPNLLYYCTIMNMYIDGISRRSLK